MKKSITINEDRYRRLRPDDGARRGNELIKPK